MGINIFLPFENYIIKSSKTKDELINIIQNETDQTNFGDLDKRFRGNFKKQTIHIWGNIIFGFFKREHYYIKFFEQNNINNEIIVNIFVRSNIGTIIFYTIFMIIGIIGLISEISRKVFLEIIFIIIWIALVFILTNYLPKHFRKDDVKYLKKILE